MERRRSVENHLHCRFLHQESSSKSQRTEREAPRQENSVWAMAKPHFINIYIQMQGASKRALQLWERIHIYSEGKYSASNCHIAAKHTEFYLG
jgi:hypothetical protein